MPSLPGSKQQDFVSGRLDFSHLDMIEVNTSNQLHRANSVCASSSCNGANEAETKNYRNRTNSKVKLLVRSHAMRESTSPPRDPQNSSVSSLQNLKLVNNKAVENATIIIPDNHNSTSSIKKFANSNLAINVNVVDSKQQHINNNNEPMYNLNVTNQSLKQIRRSATSPTCRISSHNDSSSPSQSSQKNLISPINNNKSDNQRVKQNNLNTSSKCNNYIKNSQNDRSSLLQTPISPSKNKSLQKNGQSNQKNEQRKTNTLNMCNNQCSTECDNTLSVNNSNSRHNKFRHQNSSSRGSYNSGSPSLSRDSSTEFYTDSTGVDLEQFIVETINRNQKDRTVLLKIEKDLIEFAKDRHRVSHKFPNMSSYNRMLVHRVAAYFGIEHNVDQSGLSVIVTRTKNMRIPDTRFKEHIRDGLLLNEEPRRSILKRDSSSFEDTFNFKSPDRISGSYCRRSKSFEEREEEYERARRRIFKESSGERTEVTTWPYWSSSESSETSSRYRLLHPSDYSVRQTKLLKGESLDSRDPFRSNSLRPPVSKSFSFGGYTRAMLLRGDNVMSTLSADGRLMKQDSGASMCSRISPSSSGYKSQSQRSDATISPSPSLSPISNIIYNHPQISSQDIVFPEPNSQTVIWAVTNMSSVPPGSVIINPQTNQLYTNPDGSLYHFDPDNPPKFFIEDKEIQDINISLKNSEQSESQKTILNSKNDSIKKQRFQTTKHNNCNSSTTTSTITTTKGTTMTVTSLTQLTNSAIPPNVSFTTSPVPPPPPLLLPPVLHQHQQQPQIQQLQDQHQQQQPLIRAVTIQPCNHGQVLHPYAIHVPTSEPCNQSIYQHNMTHQTVMMTPHSVHGQPIISNNEQEDVYNQNSVFASYTLPVSQSGDVNELSNYFMGMNIYDQRAAGDSQTTSTHPFSSHHTLGTNQTLTNIQPVQSNYWQTSANQMTQQTMYFVPTPGTAISVNQNPGDRQQLSQQQRFTSSYFNNLPTITPPNQSNANYMNNFSVPYNSVSTVTPSPNEYTCQPPVHMVPAYYSGQSEIQTPSIIYRVPTPPIANQISSMPLMYLNSGNYLSSTALSTGTLGHLIGLNGTNSSPPGTYLAPTLVPNLIFKQNLAAGVHASIPGNSQRTSKSPIITHELFGSGSRERSIQPPLRYSLPMYQGIHIAQGDMRLMHSGMPANSKLQYIPLPSPPIQACPQSHKPLSYSSNTSSSDTSSSLDGKNQKIQKIRKQRSKITTLPSTVTQSNLYQSSLMSSFSSNVPKNMREAKPVEDNIMNSEGDNHPSKPDVTILSEKE